MLLNKPRMLFLLENGVVRDNLILTNFLNNTDPKESANDEFHVAVANTGTVDPNVKMDLIKMNQKEKLTHGSDLDRSNDGIDQEDLERQLMANKSLNTKNI
jgi:hypothetical protein